jgi:hypothetical protein
VAVRPTQRLRDLDDRVLRARTSKPFTIPCRYGSPPWARWVYGVVAIVWIADAIGSSDALHLALAVLSGIVAVTAWVGPRTEITATGITRRLHPFSRRRRVAWGEVAAVRLGKGLRLGLVELQLTDGSILGLPGVPLDHIAALRRCLTAQTVPR